MDMVSASGRLPFKFSEDMLQNECMFLLESFGKTGYYFSVEFRMDENVLNEILVSRSSILINFIQAAAATSLLNAKK